MEMGIDKAGKGDPIATVDFFNSAHREIGTDGD
jgi:hypothetical protein